ncbi:MAG: DUF3014 domain-containing protein [Gammaproteobacteria bacterium]|nr:DUF3014 domain-containing protein [Gammaproteobacteria bacterium]
MDDTEIKWLIALLVAAAALAAAWFFWDGSKTTPEPTPVEQRSPVAETEPAEPLHPVEPLSVTPGEGELVELPPLEESDSYFALALIDIFGPELETLLADEALIDKTVATVDNLTRSRIAEKIRPVGRLSGNFIVSAAGDNGPYYLGAENYDRYKPLVNMLTGADLDELAATYRRFYPLMQEAFAQLGYPDAYLNDRVVAVIDHLLATPEPEEPIRLVQPHVLYEFADPELEALSGGQKLLIRMGPAHALQIKGFLTELRTRIAQPPR